MLSCLVDTVQRPVKKCNLLSSAENTLLIVQRDNENESARGYSVTSFAACSANAELPAVDKNCFFTQLGLVPTQSSAVCKQSEVVECNVIVIDDDDYDDQIPSHQDSCIADLFGTTRRLRGDLQVNGSASSRLLQPCSRLRKLLSIDISSALGSRTLQCVMSTLKSDGMPLNPYTVSHSLAGSDNALDYGTFCRTPVKFSGRLRQREFPVKYRPASASTHYHHYCFGRADRRRFCRRFDSGLSSRSYRLRRKCGRCSVVMERLSAEEISDWRSSQRLRDYVMRMEEKEKAAKIANLSHNDEVINVSSDSEDEVSTPARKQDLMFSCHQCDVKLPCDSTFRSIIREHYRTCHGIVNIDIVRIVQLDGSTTMQIIHVPASGTVASTPTVQHGSSLSLVHPGTSQSSGSLVRGQAQLVAGIQPPSAGEAVTTTSLTANSHAHPVAGYQPRSHMSAQLQHTIQPSEVISGPGRLLPLPRKPFNRNSVLLNGSVFCHGDAASTQSSDADVICLD